TRFSIGRCRVGVLAILFLCLPPFRSHFGSRRSQCFSVANPPQLVCTMAVNNLLIRLGCKRRSDGLALLGIPGEYVWGGLGDEEINAYYEAKEKALDQLELTDADQFLSDAELMQRVPPAKMHQLQELLIRRAVRLVRVLVPIDQRRKGLRSMQSKGYLPPSYVSSFERAEDLCDEELLSIMEESQLLDPGSPRLAIIQLAARTYHQVLAEMGADGDNDQPKVDDMKSSPSPDPLAPQRPP
ncbi:unnamed protein product, partial [Prorocentrum cordatum]